MSNKKAIDPGVLPDAIEDKTNKLTDQAFESTRGIGGDPIIEAHPEFLSLPNEEIVGQRNASRIVIGRDRPSNRYSGYGGIGDTQADAMDIVVGAMSSVKINSDKDSQKYYADPNFVEDAARIYISQKTDIDKNFGLCEGSFGSAKARSGIGIKADNVRIITREGIKLVTGVDQLNAQGGKNNKKCGIDLIAGNDDSDLQPIPKGKNVIEAIEDLVKHIDNLNGIVDSILMAQMAMNSALTNHFHFSPFFGQPTTPSQVVQAAGIKCMMDHLTNAKKSLVFHKVNLVNFKQTYLQPYGKVYINSRLNNTN